MLEGHLQKLTDEIYVTGTQMDLSALALRLPCNPRFTHKAIGRLNLGLVHYIWPEVPHMSLEFKIELDN